MGVVTLPKRDMGPDVSIQTRGEGRRYEAVLRISEVLSVCREPEDLTKVLSEELREFLDFFARAINGTEQMDLNPNATNRRKSEFG